MMNPQPIDLTPLKNLHLMDQPSWWPPAYGWWVVLTILIITCILILLFYKWWINRPIVYATREIQQIQIQQHSDLDFLHTLSNLMKRVAILKFGRETVSPLTEKKWQQFLMQAAPQVLPSNIAKLLAFSPYLTKLPRALDRSHLTNQVQEWIRQVLKK